MKIDEIKQILQQEFPGREITTIEPEIRNNGNLSISCYVDREKYYLSSLPKKAREKIYKHLNN